MKQFIFILLLFILFPFFSNGQISYDHDISLPDTIFGSSAPRDIVYLDNLIFVYTYKRLLVFNESKIFQGKIEFGNLGRFATQFRMPWWYVPDVQMMVADPSGHQLFFVTPSLRVLRIKTDTLNLVADTILNTPNIVGGKNLHGYTKLEFDSDNDRLFWLIEVQNDNYHSWNSHFGVYRRKPGTTNFDPIYTEFIDGSELNGYLEVVQTFEFNPHNDDFYLSRKMKIDVMTVVNNDSVDLKQRIPTTTPRTAKMVFIDDGTPHYLMTFPAYLPSDDFFQTPDTLQIYQINTATLNVTTIDAPNKMVTDAIYLPNEHHLVTCFVNYQPYYQAGIANKDFAVYSYANGALSFKQALNTNSSQEWDTTDFSRNTTFRLLEKSDGKLFLSKKNEIIELTPSTTGSYTFNTAYASRDSYFGKAVQASNNVFVINNVGSGLDFFTAGFHGQLKTAYPAFNIVHNTVNRKLYFFNRLSTENMGFYVYNPDNDSVEDFVETQKPIGDLVYNPVLNQILVSEFGKNSGIKVYNAETNAEVNTLSFTGRNFYGRMFVAPNNKIYISANMKVDNNPLRLIILNASDNSLDGTLSIGLTENDTMAYSLQSHFCYNPYNEKVYATFSHYRSFLPPYLTSFHASYPDDYDPTENPLGLNGLLISIDKANVMQTIASNIENAGELICTKPDTLSEKSDYQGTVFIASTQFHILACSTGVLTSHPGIKGTPADMTYSPQTNCLYVYSHKRTHIDGLDTNRIYVHKIKEDGTYNTILEKEGFGASISFNKYDGQIYFYYRSDKFMLGGNPAKIYTLNPYADTIEQTVSVALPTYSFMPEMVPQTNNAFFDPYSGKAFFPNGMHSSVSVLNFDIRETLVLHPGKKGDQGFTWLSIPRHTRTALDEKTATNVVFDQNNISGNLLSLELRNNNIDETDPPGNEGGMEYAYWDYSTNEWTYVGDEIDSIHSTKGYTLLHSPNETKFLYLYGELEDPQTTMDIYCKKDNWLGYFLYEEQDVFDALADIIPDIYHIQHQYYNCWRHGITIPNECNNHKSAMTDTPGNWVCQGSARNIKYGDMIKVSPFEDIIGFQWNSPGNPPDNSTSQQTAYYTYEEEPSYSTFVIELDSTGNNPVEIGAFVNDTCIGASVVESTDSVVVLSAYLGEHPGDSVVFEQYYGSEKSAGKQIKDYFVRTPAESQKQKRVLKTGEKSNVFIISFYKGTKEHQDLDSGLAFDIYPNPATNRLYYSLNLNDDRFVSISISDITGKLMAVPVEENFDSGTVKGEIKLISFSGEKLKAGIYLVQLKAGQILETKKMIVN